MFNFLFNNKGEDKMARAKISKTQKVLNLLNSGAEVTWKSLRNKFDLRSPTSMIGKLRNQGVMIYTNRSSKGVSYRVGTPSKAVIAAGQKALFGNTAYGAYLNKGRFGAPTKMTEFKNGIYNTLKKL